MRVWIGWLWVMFASSHLAAQVTLPVHSDLALQTPRAVHSAPTPGRRTIVTPGEYAGTEVHHTLYLPSDWTADGTPIPIIFEYTGNRHPPSGSSGKVEDAGLGFGLSAGRFIWVVLPFISSDGRRNEDRWWGDLTATVQYAKTNVPRIIQRFSADPNAVFLCGFSRGAIAVNHIGLHDDEIGRLWTAFVTHDHFDGVREWKGTQWGSPLDQYREQAAIRLKRVAGRPYLVCQNGHYGTKSFVETVLPRSENFQFLSINTQAILGEFPNQFAKASHNDRWLSLPSADRTKAWQWINDVIRSSDR
ncbi:hypothetical protein LOC71_13575 [Rhodopirellula sp. JC740]|uniref:Uncharacterized protein n=1 Tax=Rhodopirellula halodulae TaxID=2894198 RepID=A0ABS8NIC4_9BACT|nr:hypothetical protein [Rhodopirellula sp. JC740]MCC9643310.1 hypothetical protein [Rhodopirellula sp. JC740]